MAKSAPSGGETRSSFGTNSITATRPPGFSAARTFLSKVTLVAEIEVVQEVRQERYVITGTEVHFESAAGDGAEMPRNSHFRSIFSGDFKNVFPVLESDFRSAVMEGDVDAEQAVSRCDIENLCWLAWCGDVRRGDARRNGEHGSHVARELDPDVIVRRECVIGGAAVANQSGHVTVFVHHHRMRKELSDGSHVRRRILVEQRRSIGRKAIGSLSFGEEAVDGEIVAKHSDAFLCGMAERRDRVRSGRSGSNVGENFELDGSFEGHGELIGSEGLVDPAWIDRDRVGL